MHAKNHCCPHWGIIKRFYWIPLKSIEFNGVDTTGFLKNFVVLMFLFLFVDFFEVILLKTKNPLLLTKLKIEKFLLKFLFFNGFSLDTFRSFF